jgi:LemA protein
MLWSLLLVLVLPALWALSAYNRLVRLRNQVRTAWADIDVQLVRRHDLVPQLVSVAKAAAEHERSTFALVSELRAQALGLQVRGGQGAAALGEVETRLQQALGQVFALGEAYPALRSSENFLALQKELSAIEEHLQYARRFYNGAVRDYNDAVQRVPDLWIAQLGRFRSAEFYQAQAAERAVPEVQL